MTQSDLASQIGIARSTLSDYMNYRAKPSSGVLEKMAAVFRVTKSDIDTTYKNTKVEIVDGELQLVQENPLSVN
ncbi:helix-turn-helix domain-containing protein [Bacillus cereus]